MSCRRKERVGGGQTTKLTQPGSFQPSSARSSARELAYPPPASRARTAVAYPPPASRAQTADLPRHDPVRGTTARGLGRASTASTASAASRRGGSSRQRGNNSRMNPRKDIFLPAADFSAYEPDESSKFYTTSTVCTLGRICSDSCLIQPAWTRVTTSPCGEAAKVCGGYGKRLTNGTNSVDAPDFMYSKRFEFHERDFSWKKRPRPFAYHGEANTAVSDDTPQFFRRQHTQVYGRPMEKMDKPRLYKLLSGKQIIGEPAVPETDCSKPLQWEDTFPPGSH